MVGIRPVHSHRVRGLIDRQVAGLLGKAKIEDFDLLRVLLTANDEDVGRFYVAMNDPELMCLFESPRQLQGKLQHLTYRQRPSPQRLPHRLALEQLHDEIWLAFVLAEVMNRADIGMVQRGGSTRFSKKTLMCGVARRS
jgi:hypothetical protein